MTDMKLYVWQDVLCDYSCGMIVALAPDLDTAVALGRKDGGDRLAEEMGRVVPDVTPVTAAAGSEAFWYVYGGG
jgi:hypothetical protein